jgi:hypothetical protein
MKYTYRYKELFLDNKYLCSFEQYFYNFSEILKYYYENEDKHIGAEILNNKNEIIVVMRSVK